MATKYDVVYIRMSGARRGTCAEKGFMKLVDALAFAFTRAATTACEPSDIHIVDRTSGAETTVELLLGGIWATKPIAN